MCASTRVVVVHVMEKVAMFINSYYFNSCFILLQKTLDDSGEGKFSPPGKAPYFEIDPGIKITYADPRSIDNCLSLPSVNMVGPANGLPRLHRGEKSVRSIVSNVYGHR